MKNYGNIVRQYVPKELASEYPEIVTDSLKEYQEIQLADLEKFLTVEIKVDPMGNAMAQDKNAEIHRDKVRLEIAALKAQLNVV